jgi:hypothetical protein
MGHTRSARCAVTTATLLLLLLLLPVSHFSVERDSRADAQS